MHREISRGSVKIRRGELLQCIHLKSFEEPCTEGWAHGQSGTKKAGFVIPVVVGGNFQFTKKIGRHVSITVSWMIRPAGIKNCG